jgi:alanine racemase
LSTKKSKIDPLQRVIAWKSKIMSVKKKIESLSGMELVSLQKEKWPQFPLAILMAIAVSLSNQGRVLIKGQQCIVVGSVNMNMMTVDVTNLESVKKDDEVVLIGSQNEISISIAFSDYSNQLNYELLTRISKTIPRKIID